MKLVRLVYLVTSKFPQAEQYGLTAQLRRSAISIPSNIAEGAARSGAREFAYFLNVARGSISELETQLLIAQELDFIEAEVDLFHCLDRVSKLVTGLHRSVSG